MSHILQHCASSQAGTEFKYCFSLAYIYTFLTSGLGIPEALSFPVIGAVSVVC